MARQRHRKTCTDVPESSTTKASVKEFSKKIVSDQTPEHQDKDSGMAEDKLEQQTFGGNPWDSWLVLWDKEREKAFWQNRTDRLLLKLERFAFAMIAIEAITIWGQLAFEGLLFSPGLHLGNLFVLLASIWAMLQAHHQNKLYVSHRSLFVGTLRVVLYPVMVWNIVRQPPPGATPGQFMMRMLGKSSLPAMLTGSLVLQVPLKIQILVTVLCFAITVFMGCPGYCDKWYGRDAGPFVFKPILKVADNAVLSLSLLGWDAVSSGPSHESGPDFDCCIVVSLIFAALGVVLPGAIMYCWESHAKLGFLSGEAQELRKWARQKFFEAAFMCTWVSVVASMAIWSSIQLAPVALMAVTSCPRDTLN